MSEEKGFEGEECPWLERNLTGPQNLSSSAVISGWTELGFSLMGTWDPGLLGWGTWDQEHVTELFSSVLTSNLLPERGCLEGCPGSLPTWSGAGGGTGASQGSGCSRMRAGGLPPLSPLWRGSPQGASGLQSDEGQKDEHAEERRGERPSWKDQSFAY